MFLKLVNVRVLWLSTLRKTLVIIGSPVHCRFHLPLPLLVHSSMPARWFRLPKARFASPANPLAVVIAESRYIAEDAFDDIILDVEPLPAVCDLEKGWEDTSVLVHEDLPSNMAALVKQEAGNYEEARKEC